MFIKSTMRGLDSEPCALVGPAFLYTKLNFLKNIPIHSSGEMHELVEYSQLLYLVAQEYFFNIDKQKQKHFDYFIMLVNAIRALSPGPILSLQGPRVL